MKQRLCSLFLALLMIFSTLTLASCTASENPNGEESQTETQTEEQKKPQSNSAASPVNDEGTEWINAKEFGFSADGRTPNDKKMKEYIKYYGRTPLYFPNGTYAFEETIAFTDRIYIYMDPDAVLLCTAEEPLDYFITQRADATDWVPFADYSQQSFIRGGTIDANFKANTALGLHGGFHTHYQDFEIRNVLKVGIETEICELKDGCSYFDNILIYNSKAIKGTIGIYDNGYDCTFSYITVLNFETGIKGGGTLFEHVSCWFNSYGKELIPTSVYAEITGGNPVFIHPMVDTYRTGFKLRGGANITISNMTWIVNKNFFPDDVQAQYPMLVFDADSDDNRVMLNGLYLPWLTYFDFSNIPLPSSSFMNVRYPSGWSPAFDMKNFRDDTAAMKELIEVYQEDADILREMIDAYKASQNQ